MFNPEIHIATNNEEMVNNLRTWLEDRLRGLQTDHGIISIGVSGGSMPKTFCDAILAIKDLDWRRIRIFMVDERHVELTHPDSNYGAYIKLLPEQYHENVVAVPISESVSKSAQLYELHLRKHLMPEQYNAFARFDILLLGVGPDGHTCSLFPGAERLPKCSELNWVSATSESPKPPSKRVTLQMNILTYGKNVAFIINGDQKAKIVKGIVTGDLQYPAAQVRPINDQLTLFLDTGSASQLPPQTTGSESPIQE